MKPKICSTHASNTLLLPLKRKCISDFINLYWEITGPISILPSKVLFIFKINCAKKPRFSHLFGSIKLVSGSSYGSVRFSFLWCSRWVSLNLKNGIKIPTAGKTKIEFTKSFLVGCPCNISLLIHEC